MKGFLHSAGHTSTEKIHSLGFINHLVILFFFSLMKAEDRERHVSTDFWGREHECCWRCFSQSPQSEVFFYYVTLLSLTTSVSRRGVNTQVVPHHFSSASLCTVSTGESNPQLSHCRPWFFISAQLKCFMALSLSFEDTPTPKSRDWLHELD